MGSGSIVELFVTLLFVTLLFVALLFVALLFVALLFVALLFVALLFVALLFVALLFVTFGSPFGVPFPVFGSSLPQATASKTAPIKQLLFITVSKQSLVVRSRMASFRNAIRL